MRMHISKLYVFRVMKTNLLERQTTDINLEIGSRANVTKMARTITIMRKDGSESPCGITPLPGSKICMIVQMKGKCNFFFPIWDKACYTPSTVIQCIKIL